MSDKSAQQIRDTNRDTNRDTFLEYIDAVWA
jgi:hypothetical protein